MTAPLVTIAVPSFNQGPFLDDALASIFQQKIPVEVYVLDGGSSDNSLEIIRKWELRLAGWRSHADDGQAAAINEGIAQGSAPYVCWLNSVTGFCQTVWQSLSANWKLTLRHLLCMVARGMWCRNSASAILYGWSLSMSAAWHCAALFHNQRP